MIEILKQLSPVSIEFMVLEHPDNLGVFFWGDETALFTGRRIEISESLLQLQRIAILSHEVGHALHCKKDCRHFENLDHLKREIYAHKYSLRFLLKHKQKESLIWLMQDIKERSHHQSDFEKILKHLIKLKLWQKCLDYIK